MIQLCCSEEHAKEYEETYSCSSKAAVFSPAAILFGIEDALQQMEDAFARATGRKGSLNKYTTTLHAINSAIVKLSKLTIAKRVYRGVQGRTLPNEFMIPNEFGVKGGIEAAFMSTTTNKEEALKYAAGSGASVVFEIQQGMVGNCFAAVDPVAPS